MTPPEVFSFGPRHAVADFRCARGGLLLLALVLAACEESLPPDPETRTLTGEWVATKGPAHTFFTDADTFRLVLVQTDTLVSGTWGATGPEGVVVRPIQEVSGRNVDGSIQLSLRLDRRANGLPALSVSATTYFGAYSENSEIRTRYTHAWLGSPIRGSPTLNLLRSPSRYCGAGSAHPACPTASRTKLV